MYNISLFLMKEQKISSDHSFLQFFGVLVFFIRILVNFHVFKLVRLLKNDMKLGFEDRFSKKQKLNLLLLLESLILKDRYKN